MLLGQSLMPKQSNGDGILVHLSLYVSVSVCVVCLSVLPLIGLHVFVYIWDRFHDNYLAEESQKQNPLVSPLLNKSFDGLPPCLLLIAEHDPLHDECLGMLCKR